jgi:hypothetical protein
MKDSVSQTLWAYNRTSHFTYASYICKEEWTYFINGVQLSSRGILCDSAYHTNPYVQ